MSIPRGVRTEISQDGDLRADQSRYRSNTAKTMRAEGCDNHRSTGVPGPYLYAYQCTTEIQRVAGNGVLEREKQLMIYDRHANLKYKYGNRHFWCRGYYVDTVGRNKKQIQEYIRNQLIEDEQLDQMTIKEYVDPFTGCRIQRHKIKPL